ncbi:MAG: hypothetical protein LBM75_05495 [Myxococcales bacterium]|nr:hypothetical protein [Myxococcales bacterium]
MLSAIFFSALPTAAWAQEEGVVTAAEQADTALTVAPHQLQASPDRQDAQLEETGEQQQSEQDAVQAKDRQRAQTQDIRELRQIQRDARREERAIRQEQRRQRRQPTRAAEPHRAPAYQAEPTPRASRPYEIALGLGWNISTNPRFGNGPMISTSPKIQFGRAFKMGLEAEFHWYSIVEPMDSDECMAHECEEEYAKGAWGLSFGPSFGFFPVERFSLSVAPLIVLDYGEKPEQVSSGVGLGFSMGWDIPMSESFSMGMQLRWQGAITENHGVSLVSANLIFKFKD